MKSCFSRALALILSLVMIFTVNSTAYAVYCAKHAFGAWQISKVATCKEKGELSRSCTKCDYTETMATNEAHNTKETVVSANCTTGGYRKSVCETCGKVLEETEIPPLEHAFGNTVTDKEASCTEDGKLHTTCTVCGFTKEETIQKTGHKFGSDATVLNPTCTEDGIRRFVCTVCSEEINETIPAPGHEESIIKGTEASCTEDGLSDGKFCKICEAVLAKQEVIPAFGHENINVPRLEPTCTEKGLTESVVCKHCGLATIKSEEIPAKGHTKITVPAVPATCVKAGLTEGEKCADCDYIFTPQNEIPTLTHEHEIIPAVPSTCIKTGLTEGKYCKICDVVVVKQTVTPPSGHSEVFYQALAPTCDEVGYKAGKRCSVCGKILEGLDEIPALGHTEDIYPEIPATCTSAGKSEGRKCLVCDKVTKEQVVIPATGHTEVVDYAVSATCQRTGLTEGRHCLSCKKVIVKQETVPKAPHYIIPIEAVEATCTKPGKTAGERCAVCDLVVTNQKTTLPLGHTSKSRLTEATLNSDGSLQTYCDRCDKVLTSTPIKKIESIKLSATSYTYGGKTKTPSVTVTDANGKKLIKDTDYTLKYSSGRKNPGKYKVKVTFKGNYSGSKTYTYTIIPAKTTITAKQSTSSIKLTWKAVPGAYGYRVYLYNSTSKKWSTLIKATKETTYTFKSLTPGTTYRYAVRAYARDGSVIWGKLTDIYVTTKPSAPAISSLDSSNGKVTAKWNAVTGATGYVVYYAKSKNGSYKKLGSTKDRTFTSKKLSGGRTYYIRIKAYIKTDNGNIYSGASNIKSVYVK